MVDLINRLAKLEREELEDLDFFNATQKDNPKADASGQLSRSKRAILRFIALCDYVLRHDKASFQKHLAESVKLSKSLFDRHNEQALIDDSFVTMNSWCAILDAFAAGDFALATEFAQVIGGRDAIEEEHDHPFDLAFGYALKTVVLDQSEQAHRWLSLANEAVQDKSLRLFQGYVDVLIAINDQDEQAFITALQVLLQDHHKQVKRGGFFENKDDEVLCFYALGLVNLARYKGMDVSADDELLPQALIANTDLDMWS